MGSYGRQPSSVEDGTLNEMSTWIEICDDVTGKSKCGAKPFTKAFTKIEILK